MFHTIANQHDFMWKLSIGTPYGIQEKCHWIVKFESFLLWFAEDVVEVELPAELAMIESVTVVFNPSIIQVLLTSKRRRATVIERSRRVFTYVKEAGNLSIYIWLLKPTYTGRKDRLKVESTLNLRKKISYMSPRNFIWRSNITSQPLGPPTKKTKKKIKGGVS